MRGVLLDRHRSSGSEGGTTGAAPPKVFVNLNTPGSTTKSDLEAVKARGYQGVRAGEGEVGQLGELLTWCHELGLGLVWITFLDECHLNLIAAYNGLNAGQKAAWTAVDYLNEVFPVGAHGPRAYSGLEYRQHYVREAKALKAVSFPVPFLMQVETNPWGAVAWQQEAMPAFGTTAASELAEALRPEVWLPGGNGLSGHPYIGRGKTPQREPSNLYAMEDTEGAQIGFQRWFKWVAIVKAATGLNVPMYITEIGAAAAPGVAQSVGSWTAVKEYTVSWLEVMKMIAEGTLPKAWLPTGLGEVRVPVMVHYDWIAWSPAGAESFGVVFWGGAHGVYTINENGGGYAAAVKAAITAI